MDEAALKKLIVSVMEESFSNLIKEMRAAVSVTVAETVAAAVAQAVAAGDAERQSLKKELSETTQAVAAGDAERQSLKEELSEVKIQLNSLEQYSRRLCLDVSGIPETANEDTDRLIMDTAKLAGVEISKEEIDRSHRVGAVKPGKARTLLVRFVSYAKREAFYGARKHLREPRPFEGSTVSAAVASKVFVTDNLTRENHFILYKARQYRKEGKIFAAWSDVGKLKVRLRENGPTTVIRSLDDLLKLMQPRPQQPGPPAVDGGRLPTCHASQRQEQVRRVCTYLPTPAADRVVPTSAAPPC